MSCGITLATRFFDTQEAVRSVRRRSWIATTTLAASLAVTSTAWAQRTVDEYRYFRSLSIDLQGRIPTRDEIAAFERPDFNTERWVDEKLQSPAYAERMRTLYMDLLRLEVATSFQFNPNMIVLRRQRIQLEGGQYTYVYYRNGQRRQRAETDGDFCLSPAETGFAVNRTGQQVAPDGTLNPTLRPVTRAELDANTVAVKPWWLYRDYRNATPTQRYSATTWATMFPSFTPIAALLREPDNRTDTMEVRVCREEASTGDTGTVFAPGRTRPTVPTPAGRQIAYPADTAYGRANRGSTLNCGSTTAYQNTTDCGCGPGLERCMPGNNAGANPSAFQFPTRAPLGQDEPLDEASQGQDDWNLYWWAQEATHFLEDIFLRDRDFREVLTARDTQVNGPLTQFYRNFAGASCCRNEAQTLGYAFPEPIFNPTALPNDLLPHDTSVWRRVTDRGPHASGIMTMPAFLIKYGSRRAKVHVLYNAFMCREFVAENVQLMPSEEPNLMLRPGCASCHVAIEPLSAYFTRISETDWTWLPERQFPVVNPMCVGNTVSAMPAQCRPYYDPAFSTPAGGMLRSAYGSAANAAAGPAGMARYITGSNEFGACVAQNVAESFLGRELDSDDAALRQTLTQTMTSNGFRTRAMVRALVLSDAYRRANNLTSTAWRQGVTR